MSKVSQSLLDIQRAIAKEVVLKDQLPIESIKKVGAFHCKDLKGHMICSAVIVEFPSMKILETKHIVKKAPMQYIPGYRAFREGPLMLECYYDLENDPDVIFVEGYGVAHPRNCGLATYLGVELHKPAIGVADKLLIGTTEGEDILLDNEVVGRVVKTKEHSNPLMITPGHLISVETAAQLVLDSVRHPHKMPEPLHIARKLATRVRKTRREQVEKPAEKSELLT